MQAAILLLIVGFFAAGPITAIRGMNEVLTEDATRTAERFARAYVAKVDQLDKVLAGEELSDADNEYLEYIAAVGNAFRYKVFDANGTLRLISDTPDGVNGTSLRDHNPEIADRVLSGGTHAAIYDGTEKPHRPDTYAEAYVPFIEDGRVRGIIEVYVDVSETHALLKRQMLHAVALTLAMAALAVLHTLYTAWLLRRQQKSDDRLYHLAHNDALTGIANRTNFTRDLEGRLTGKREGDGSLALHMIDLDGFKGVNDSLGHDIGDALLCRAAARIADCVRSGDTVSRLGGDEFAVIQGGVADAEHAERLSRRIIRTLSDIREINGLPVNISASVGVALAPDHSVDASDLQKCADVALYHAKNTGRDRAVMFEPGMDQDLRERNTLRVALREALESESFELHYQPLHAVGDDALISFEALLRLPDGKGGHISPAVFIPVAEEMGLTPKLGAWVLEQACLAAAAWPEHLTVAVNLSPQQFGRSNDIVAVVRQALETSGLTPERLELEITETLFIRDRDVVEKQLRGLKALGTRIAMDDFGTGYSSLSYLWQFPFDKVKVDRSCFMALGKVDSVGEVLRTISAMSEAMKLRVVAEGVETDAQRSFAKDAGYHEAQGYLYSRPMRRADVAAYINKIGTPAAQAPQVSPTHACEAARAAALG